MPIQKIMIINDSAMTISAPLRSASPCTPSTNGPRHGPFVVPQKIRRAENDPGHRNGGILPVCFECAEQDQNSPTNPFVPGKPMEANPMIRKNVASNGAFFARPPNALRRVLIGE